MKAALAPGAVFVVGADTIERIGEPRYYSDSVDRRDEAIDAIRAAVDAGYRDLTRDFVVSMRDDPLLKALNGDPRYEAQWQRIEADLAKQRADYEAGRKKAAGA